MVLMRLWLFLSVPWIVLGLVSATAFDKSVIFTIFAPPLLGLGIVWILGGFRSASPHPGRGIEVLIRAFTKRP